MLTYDLFVNARYFGCIQCGHSVYIHEAPTVYAAGTATRARTQKKGQRNAA